MTVNTNMTGVHLVLAVPGWKLSPFHAQCREFLMMRCMEKGVDLSIMPEQASGIDLARNIMVAKFLETDGTHLMMIDSDLAFDPQNVFTMIEANVDIVGALYPKKVVDYAAAAKASAEGVPDSELKYHAGKLVGGAEPGSRRSFSTGDGKHRFVDADKLGTGFLAMKREALQKFISFHRERIEHHSHWEPKGLQHLVFFSECQGPRQRARDAMLKTVSRYGRQMASIDELVSAVDKYNCVMAKGQPLDEYQTEDFNFIYRAKEAGLSCWMYIDASLAHQGTWLFEGNFAKVLDHATKKTETP